MSDIDYSGLPEHLRDGMRRYVEDGIEPGSFLRACLENDLVGAFAYRSAGSNIEGAVYWICNHAPLYCWGSRENVKDWIQMGGLRGLEEERES